MKRHGGTLNAYQQVKEVNLKQLCTIRFLYVILEKANYRDSKKKKKKKNQWLSQVGGKVGQSTGNFQGNENISRILQLFILVIHLSKPIECTTARVSESHSVMSNSLQPYTVHGILQAIILQWVAFPFSRGSSQPRD